MDAHVLLNLFEQSFNGECIFVDPSPRRYLFKYRLCGLLKNVIDMALIVGIHHGVGMKFFFNPMLRRCVYPNVVAGKEFY